MLLSVCLLKTFNLGYIWIYGIHCLCSPLFQSFRSSEAIFTDQFACIFTYSCNLHVYWKFQFAADEFSVIMCHVRFFTALCEMHPMRALFLIPRNPPPRLKSKKWLVGSEWRF